MSGSPRILALDTSAAHCAAALLIGDRIVAARFEDMGRGQAERLFPMLEEVLGDEGAAWDELDAIGVGIGPGNFTGIRIGVSAARGLAVSLGIPAVGVNGFEMIRTGADVEFVLLPAARDQVYAALWSKGDWNAPILVDPHQGGRDFMVPDGAVITGEKADVVAECCAREGGGAGYRVTVPRHLHPAEIIAGRAAEALASGRVVPRPAPLYVRPADAAPASDPPPVILP